MTLTSSLDLGRVQVMSRQRNKEWDPDTKLDYMFFAVELAGEAGEAGNKCKKLRREALGLKGSTSSIDAVGMELGDVILSACNLANSLRIDLPHYVREAFNQKSKELGFDTLI
jgi:NTP pyrophosphatase (non-canonical NTP hydrolase)